MQIGNRKRVHAPVGTPTAAAGQVAVDQAIVLRGIGLDRRLDWLYAPKGWDVGELERGGDFRPCGNTPGQRRGLVTPTRVRQWIVLYGQGPVVDLQAEPALSELLDRHTLVVEVLLARRQLRPALA